jgi:hypothetical protein
MSISDQIRDLEDWMERLDAMWDDLSARRDGMARAARDARRWGGDGAELEEGRMELEEEMASNREKHREASERLWALRQLLPPVTVAPVVATTDPQETITPPKSAPEPNAWPAIPSPARLPEEPLTEARFHGEPDWRIDEADVSEGIWPVSGEPRTGEPVSAAPVREGVLAGDQLRSLVIQLGIGVLLGAIMGWIARPQYLGYGSPDRVWLLAGYGLIAAVIYSLPLRGFSGPGHSKRRIILVAVAVGLLVWAGASILYNSRLLTPILGQRWWFITGGMLCSGLLFPVASHALKTHHDWPLLLVGTLLVIWTLVPLHTFGWLRQLGFSLWRTTANVGAVATPSPVASLPTAPPARTPTPTLQTLVRPSEVSTQAQPGTVTDVPDGGALQVRFTDGQRLVRYVNISIPTGTQPGAAIAARAHATLLREQQVWVAPVVSSPTGEWAYVWLADGWSTSNWSR